MYHHSVFFCGNIDEVIGILDDFQGFSEVGDALADHGVGAVDRRSSRFLWEPGHSETIHRGLETGLTSAYNTDIIETVKGACILP